MAGNILLEVFGVIRNKDSLFNEQQTNTKNNVIQLATFISYR